MVSSYDSGLIKFKEFPGTSKLILNNVAEAIRSYTNHPYYEMVLGNAIKDKEWLLLPASEMIMNNGAIEFSVIMDGNCISEIIRYQILAKKNKPKINACQKN